MNKEEREKIAAFRFSVIYPLLDTGKDKWGEKSRILEGLTSKEWNIPGLSRTSISKPTILSWLKKYENGGRQIQSLHPKRREDARRVQDHEQRNGTGLYPIEERLHESLGPSATPAGKGSSYPARWIQRLISEHLQDFEEAWVRPGS